MEKSQNRKSKSLEEESKLQRITFEDLFNELNPSFAEYRSLTEYDEGKDSIAKNFISKQKRFEELGLLKCIGSDKEGVVYFLVYGNKYSGLNKEQKQLVKLDLFSIVDHVASASMFTITYFHSKIGKMGKGLVNVLRDLYINLIPEKQEKMQHFHIIHPNFYIKTKMLMSRSCIGKKDMMRKVSTFDSVVKLIESLNSDPSIGQRIIVALPAEIHELYVSEKELQKNKKQKSKSEIQEQDAFNSYIKQLDLSSTFHKEIMVSNENNQSSVNLPDPYQNNSIQTSDVVGKYIHEFKRKTLNSVPEIFILLSTYFEISPHLLETPFIFRMNGAIDKIEELQIHLAMGNYHYLTELENEPLVVAGFLKKVLNCMAEPLCTFKNYYKFRELIEIPKENKLDKIKEICQFLPELHRNTFVFLIHFFNKVISYQEKNKMTLHNIATVITPNVFRAKELTQNDLIYCGHLVEMFKLMIQNCEYIFEGYEISS